MNNNRNNRRVPGNGQNPQRKSRKNRAPASKRGARPASGAARQGQGPMQSAAVAYTQLQGSSRPIFSTTESSGDLRIRVKHREYIGDILGSAAYAVNGYALQPGLPGSFPWLSTISANFESYMFHALRFQYRTQAATTATGKALLSVDWDAADAAPLSKQAQLQERTKADDASWRNFDMVCDRADLNKFGIQRYIRTGALAANLDIKTYDIGNLWVGTQGEANANAIGELWVCYDVDLITPQQNQGGLSQSEKITSGGTVSNAAPFGTVPVIAGAQSATVNAAGTTLTFPVGGQFLMEIDQVGTVIDNQPVFTGTATVTETEALINAAATQLLASYTVSASAGQTIIFTMSNSTTTTSLVARLAPYLVSLA